MQIERAPRAPPPAAERGTATGLAAHPWVRGAGTRVQKRGGGSRLWVPAQGCAARMRALAVGCLLHLAASWLLGRGGADGVPPRRHFALRQGCLRVPFARQFPLQSMQEPREKARTHPDPESKAKLGSYHPISTQVLPCWRIPVRPVDAPSCWTPQSSPFVPPHAGTPQCSPFVPPHAGTSPCSPFMCPPAAPAARPRAAPAAWPPASSPRGRGSCFPQAPVPGLGELKMPDAALIRGGERDLGGSLSKSYY